MKGEKVVKKVIVIVLALVLAIGLALPVAAHTEGSPQVQTLYAGQDIDVGTVSVWNDSDNLYVKYETTGGWVMTATHLYAGQNVPPTTAPGQFPYDDDDATLVTDTVVTYEIPLDDIDSYSMRLNKKGKSTGVMVADGTPGVEPCNDVYIAAQADVQIETMRGVISAVTPFSGFDVTSSFSGGDGEVNLGTSSLNLLSGFGQLSGYYGASLSNLTHRATRGLGVHQGESDEVDREDPENEESIEITFDSAVYVDWFEIRSLFTKDQPPNEQARVRLYNGATLVDTQYLVGQQDLGSGPGVVSVDYAAPEPEADKLVFDVPPPYETGHEFAVAALEVFQIREETAWGDGDRFVNRGNWAMYFTYHVQGPSVETGNLLGGNGEGGVRYKSFANTGSREMYVGIPDLGDGDNRVETDFTWSSPGTHTVSFAYDETEDKLVGTVDSTTLEWPDISMTADPSSWDAMLISVVARHSGTTVDFNDVELNGYWSLGDFSAVYNQWNNWTVSWDDFSESWTLTGDIVLTGTFSGCDECSKVEIQVGQAP
jgi:hypothetical protein